MVLSLLGRAENTFEVVNHFREDRSNLGLDKHPSCVKIMLLTLPTLDSNC